MKYRWSLSRKSLFVMPYGLRAKLDKAASGMYPSTCWQFPQGWEWENNLSLIQPLNAVQLRVAARITTL